MARTVRSYTFEADGSRDFGVMADPQIQVTGTWGSGTITVTLDGVDLLTTYTDDFEKIFDTSGVPAKISLTLASSTSPDLDVTVVGATNYGASVSGR